MRMESRGPFKSDSGESRHGVTPLLTYSLPAFILFIYAVNLPLSNNGTRNAVLRCPGITNVDGKSLVGFFHPHWSWMRTGLWTAVAFLQRTEPNLVSAVCTGDADAMKDAMIDKVKLALTLTFRQTRCILYSSSRGV
ncbi:hypothetical protein BD410DRAFT_178735 [Rickenella mellea]|uniref:Uncharacterized protein n=1 Tax=Rickenella mellea TaxID=50990 RepID=A0A4Y7Q7N5_9AGAM|nr:hypothetical protein BD410DRAFT_178735 [Rickenella mellea]